MTQKLAVTLNALALYAIATILLMAFYWQIAFHELPCPLCLLQRVGFIALAFGPILTIRHGPRPLHYGLVILAAVCGAIIAGRQVLLHIQPGDPGFGSPFLGFHFYTWAFLLFAAAIVAAAIMLLFDGQFDRAQPGPAPGAFETAAVWLVVALTLLNAGSVLLECGFAACPADPVRYELLSPATT
jgi:disulfide bond formation protein DsbB